MQTPSFFGANHLLLILPFCALSVKAIILFFFLKLDGVFLYKSQL